MPHTPLTNDSPADLAATASSPRTNKPSLKHASLARRLAALTYDLLLVVAIAFIVTSLYVTGFALITGAHAGPQNPLLLQLTLFPLIVLACFSYFAISWLRGGRTLGMRAWHLRLQSDDAAMLTLRQCMLRSLGASLSMSCFGLGFAAALIDRQQRSWHDRWSHTVVVSTR